MITPSVREAYERDGVVCLRGAVSAPWLDAARRGVAQNIAAPGRFFRDYTVPPPPDSADSENSSGRYTFEYWNWRRIPEFADLAFNSEMAPLAAALLGAKRLTLLMDQWFRREAGCVNAACWHHDEPYFDFFGGRKCVVWFPLDDTPAAEGLTFFAGSHKWGKLYMAQNFAERAPFAGQGAGYEPVQDFDALPGARLLNWDMRPGDCLIFDFRTLHRASNDTAPVARTGERISYRFGDENVVFKPRGPWTAETSAFLTKAGQIPGAELGCPWLPQVFPHETAAAPQEAQA
ncbi:MAG: phytanoyl-CoA dioxygenase family protein [Rhodospirillales bacterium]